MLPNNWNIGAVVIGRNEGQRLKICLSSLKTTIDSITYVDSGSTDNSVSIAEQLGVIVVRLDMSLPFTAARARNTGFSTLLGYHPELQYVQFIDGDCELIPDWLPHAHAFMQQHPDCAVACGRRKERFPENSIYNQLCDIEWNTPIGEAKACGGDALIRVTAFQHINGYKDNLIAGEEPEMCFRLRLNGWKIWRLNQDMTWHDAALIHFRQWWKRCVRSGHGFTEVSRLHKKSEERFWQREYQRIIIWGLVIPISILILISFHEFFVVLFMIFPIQMLKIAIKFNANYRLRFYYGFYTVLGKFAETQGLLKYWLARLTNKSVNIIEYK